MKEEDAARIIEGIVKKQLEEAMKPVVELFTGQQLAIVHVFNTLHFHGVADREQIIQSLDRTISDNSSSLPPAASMAIRQIRDGLIAHAAGEPKSPDQLRDTFRIVTKAPGATPPED